MQSIWDSTSKSLVQPFVILFSEWSRDNDTEQKRKICFEVPKIGIGHLYWIDDQELYPWRQKIRRYLASTSYPNLYISQLGSLYEDYQITIC